MQTCSVSRQPFPETITVWAAQEAPPAIISIFVGEQIQDVIDQLCSPPAPPPTPIDGRHLEDRRDHAAGF